MADTLANYVKFLRGTPTAFANLKVKDADTLYFVSEKDAKIGKLYLGEQLISDDTSTNDIDIIEYLRDLKDVDVSGTTGGNILGFNETTQKWVSMNISSFAMSGASATKDGQGGLVPAPQKGQQNHFLSGEGVWKAIEIPESLIHSVSDDFIIDDNNQLILKEIEINKIIGLQESLENKVEKQFYEVPVLDADGNPVIDEDGKPVVEIVEGKLLTPEDQKKVDALIFDENGNITISSSIEAEKVIGLDNWIENNRNTISGLFSATAAKKLSDIQEGAEVNKISTVSTEFTLADRELSVNKISYTKIDGLENFVKTEVKNLTDAALSETVSLADFNEVIGDLDEMKKAGRNVILELDTLTNIVSWQEM